MTIPPKAVVWPANEPYQQALGTFIEAFACTESLLFAYVADQSQMPPPIFRIVSSGWHIEGLVSFLKKVWAVFPLSPTASDMKSAVDQFMEINGVRNNVIHYASELTMEGERISTNAARKAANKEEHRIIVSPEILSNMTKDLAKIGCHTMTVMMHPTKSLAERAKDMGLLADAFLYKPNANPPA